MDAKVVEITASSFRAGIKIATFSAREPKGDRGVVRKKAARTSIQSVAVGIATEITNTSNNVDRTICIC